MITDESEPDEGRIVDSAVAKLSEHFDSVLILVTRRTTESTRMFHRGGGNYYASYGAVREYLIQEDEKTKKFIRGD